MSKNETKPTTAVQNTTKAVAEPTYTVEEFAKSPKTLGCDSFDIVKAALSEAGKDTYTVTEAKNIVNKFKNKEVK